jgi:hypothetical protein
MRSERTHAQMVAATSFSLPSRHLRLSSSWPNILILSLLMVPEPPAISPLDGVEVRDFRANTLGNGAHHPLRKYNKGVVHRFEFVSVGNTQDGIGGAVSEMCLKLGQDMQQRPEQGVCRCGLLIEECASDSRAKVLCEEAMVTLPGS